LSQQLVVGRTGNIRERLGQEIESEVGIERPRSGCEKQLARLQIVDERVLGHSLKGIIIRPGPAFDLAREPAGVGHEINQPDLFAAPGRDRGPPAERVLERIGELQLALRNQACQHRSGERLGDGPDAQQRLAIGRLVASGPRPAESRNRALTVADSPDHQGRHFRLQEKNRSRELEGFLEKPVVRTRLRR
jgi:hypothetical protein